MQAVYFKSDVMGYFILMKNSRFCSLYGFRPVISDWELANSLLNSMKTHTTEAHHK